MRLNQLKSGVITTYIIIFLTNGISLFFTPFILKSIGQAEYGLYSLMSAFVGYMMILDFGLFNTIIRYVAKYKAEGNHKKQENFLATCLIMYCCIFLLLLIIIIVVYRNLNVIFMDRLTLDQISQAKDMFLILVLNICVSIVLNSLQAIMMAHEIFVYQNIVKIGRILIRTLILFALLNQGYKSMSIILVDTLLNIIILILYGSYVFTQLKVSVKLHHFDKNLIKDIISYSFFIFLNMVVDQIYWKVGHVVIGIKMGTMAVAIFSIAMQFSSYYITFSTAISGVFLPRTTQLVINKTSSAELTDLMIKIGRIQFQLLGYILIAFIFFGRQFIHLWVGKNYSNAYIIALIVLIPVTVPLFQTIGISILQAKKKHGFRSVVYLLIACLNIGTSIYLVEKYGAIGAAIGTSLSIVLGNIIIMNIYYHYRIGLNIPRFIKEVLKGNTTAIFFTTIVSILLLLLKGEIWGVFILKCILYSLSYFIFMWIFGLNRYEKQLFIHPILRVLKYKRERE